MFGPPTEHTQLSRWRFVLVTGLGALLYLIAGALRSRSREFESPVTRLSSVLASQLSPAHGTVQQDKFCVVSAAYGDEYLTFLRHTSVSKAAYAKKHGYAYLEFSSEDPYDLINNCDCALCNAEKVEDIDLNGTSKFWNENTTLVKFCSLKRAFLEYDCDWAAWIDADNAMFQAPSLSTPLNEFVKRSATDAQQGPPARAVFSIDAQQDERCFQHGVKHNCGNSQMFGRCLNNGVFIVRGGDYGLHFLQFVLNFNRTRAVNLLLDNYGAYEQCHHWENFDYNDQCAVAIYAATYGVDDFRCVLGANLRKLRSIKQVPEIFQLFANELEDASHLDRYANAFVAACTAEPLGKCVNFSVSNWKSRASLDPSSYLT